MNVMMSKFTITESSKGKPILQLNGYELLKTCYSANKNGTTRWRCVKKACKATLLTKGGEIVNQCNSHCHEPDGNATIATEFSTLKCVQVVVKK